MKIITLIWAQLVLLTGCSSVFMPESIQVSNSHSLVEFNNVLNEQPFEAQNMARWGGRVFAKLEIQQGIAFMVSQRDLRFHGKPDGRNSAKFGTFIVQFSDNVTLPDNLKNQEITFVGQVVSGPESNKFGLPVLQVDRYHLWDREGTNKRKVSSTFANASSKVKAHRPICYKYTGCTTLESELNN